MTMYEQLYLFPNFQALLKDIYLLFQVVGLKIFIGTVDRYQDGHVSGFRRNEGVYQLEYYGAIVEENKCTKDRVCASGIHWPDYVYDDENDVSHEKTSSAVAQYAKAIDFHVFSPKQRNSSTTTTKTL